mgnify:CR=1 FL=1|tara:strand:- start:539 stop:1042 length:504 start_codon:yes stop_codon:yes gene_type:complete
MGRFNILIVFLLVFIVGNGQGTQKVTGKGEMEMPGFTSFGDAFDNQGAISDQEMLKMYNTLSITDTLQIKFTAIVAEVCQAKGCWMKLRLDDGQQAMVRFKEYRFFMPMDIVGQEVAVNGLAFVSEMSVEDQRHYAKDAGKSAEDISKIKDSEKSFGFEADGVLLKQ